MVFVVVYGALEVGAAAAGNLYVLCGFLEFNLLLDFCVEGDYVYGFNTVCEKAVDD